MTQIAQIRTAQKPVQLPALPARSKERLNFAALRTALSSLESAAQEFEGAFFDREQEVALRKIESCTQLVSDFSRQKGTLFQRDAIVSAVSRAYASVDTRIIAPRLAKRYDVVAVQIRAICSSVSEEIAREISPRKADLAAGGSLFTSALRDSLRSQEGDTGLLNPADVLAEYVLDLPRKPKNSLPVPSGFQEVCRTPVRSSMRALEALTVTPKDVVVQLGSGVGDFVALAALMTNAKAVVGVEYAADLASGARKRFQDLGLTRVSFVGADPRFTDLTKGNKFFLDGPFYGHALKAVVQNLLTVAKRHPIVVVTTGPLEDLQEVSGGNLQRQESTSRAVITYRSKHPSEVRLPTDSERPALFGERFLRLGR
jgi:protein-L-isoaspartate O-methyltransferase